MADKKKPASYMRTPEGKAELKKHYDKLHSGPKPKGFFKKPYVQTPEGKAKLKAHYDKLHSGPKPAGLLRPGIGLKRLAVGTALTSANLATGNFLGVPAALAITASGAKALQKHLSSKGTGVKMSKSEAGKVAAQARWKGRGRKGK